MEKQILVEKRKARAIWYDDMYEEKGAKTNPEYTYIPKKFGEK